LWGEVSEVKDGFVYFRPLCPAPLVGTAQTARQVVGHWHKAGRRVTGEDEDDHEADALSREQLALPGVHK
jgi:hypothetical protein